MVMLRGLVIWIGLTVAAVLCAGPSLAEDRSFRLLADASLDQSGLLQHLLPRFSLKTAIKIEVVAVPSADVTGTVGETDVVIAEASALTDADPAFRAISGDIAYAVLLTGPDNSPGQDFIDWLLSDIGQRTLVSYQPDGKTLYRPAAAGDVAEEVEMPEGDTDLGEKLSLFHCGRCHVVNERNRMGGIGSTPSFAALRTIPGWQDRFLTFWSLNPHPSFTQVEGLTDPFDPARPPHIAPMEITQAEMDAILAYAATIPPKDLGAAIDVR